MKNFQNSLLPVVLCLILSACSSFVNELTNPNPNNDVSSNPSPVPVPAERVITVTTAGYDSFPGVSEGAKKNDKPKKVTLPAFGVNFLELNNGNYVGNNGRRRVTERGISAGRSVAVQPYHILGISQGFDEDGEINDVTLHFSDDFMDQRATDFREAYSPNGLSPDENGYGKIRYSSFEHRLLSFSVAPINDAAVIQVSNDYPFGFSAKYMAYLRWQTEHSCLGHRSLGGGHCVRIDSSIAGDGTKYHSLIYGGMFITGFETVNIPRDGTAIFNGTGHGTYHHGKATKEQILFDVTANVDFSAREVALSTHDVQKESIPTPKLEFDTRLRYDAGKNHLTGNIAADGMAGKAEARFYGTGANAAQELGGIFYMENEDDELYYGAFGAKRY